MKVRIDIDTQTFVRFWLVVIAFVLGLMALYSARTALLIIGIAFFLAMTLNPPVSMLARHLPGKSRVWGTALAYVLVVAILAVILLLVVPPIIQQTVRFTESLPELIEGVAHQWEGLGTLIEKYHLQPQFEAAMAAIRGSSTGWAASIGANILQSVGSIVSTFTSGLLVLVLSFLMLVEGPVWIKRLRNVYADKARMEHHDTLRRRMYQVFTGYVTGQLTVSSIGAIFAGITVFVISLFWQVPANLALTTVAITFTLSLIPMFGATIAGVIISVLLAFNDVTAGIVFAVYFIVYQQIENNFISPTIQSRRIELSALIVLVSVTIGLYVFGLPGGIISIPIAGCLKVLLEDYFHHRKVAKSNDDQKASGLAKLTKRFQKEANL